MVNDPVFRPRTVGLKVTVMVHLVPGATLVQFDEVVAEKSPELVWILVIANAVEALVGFVSTKFTPLLVVPNPTLPKLAWRGASCAPANEPVLELRTTEILSLAGTAAAT